MYISISRSVPIPILKSDLQTVLDFCKLLWGCEGIEKLIEFIAVEDFPKPAAKNFRCLSFYGKSVLPKIFIGLTI